MAMASVAARASEVECTADAMNGWATCASTTPKIGGKMTSQRTKWSVSKAPDIKDEC